jgi:hypothetical protein
VCDDGFSLEFFHPEAKVARGTCIVVANLRSPLDLCREAGVCAAEAIELGEDVPVGAGRVARGRIGWQLLRRVLFGLACRQEEEAAQLHVLPLS